MTDTFNHGSTAYIAGEGPVTVGTMIPGPKPADDIFTVERLEIPTADLRDEVKA